MLLTVLLLPFCIGCSSNDRVAVSGDVTLDGKPLKSGIISFRSAAANGGNSGGQIVDGQFHLTAVHGLKPGKYLVSIQAFHPTGRTIRDLQMGSIREIAPVQFNEAEHLDANLAAGESLHFRLTSAKKKPYLK